MALSPRTRFEVLKRDGFTCQYCGRKPPIVTLHVDHIEPKASGGADDLSNYLTACAECNLQKGPRPLLPVTPCVFCKVERGGMFFGIEADDRPELVCTECLQLGVLVLRRALRPYSYSCCSCGAAVGQDPQAPNAKTFTTQDIVNGGGVWVCEPCCGELGLPYRG